jgi:hypothetical protein
MYIQWFVKGIAGRDESQDGPELSWSEAKRLLADGHGITSNWWRNKPKQRISPHEVDAILNERNLDRHLHDYQNYGQQSPFISLASGSVERDTLVSQNFVYSAVTTALDFATDAWARPGALFYGWVPVALNPAVSLSTVAEEVRELNVYQRWSPFQLEGEVTAKIHIPSNQIKKVEWWDGSSKRDHQFDEFENPRFVDPRPITNVREHF